MHLVVIPAWVEIISKISGPVVTVGAFLIGTVAGVTRDRRRIKALEDKQKTLERRTRIHGITIASHTELHEKSDTAFKELNNSIIQGNIASAKALAEVNSTMSSFKGQFDMFVKMSDD